MRKNGRGRIYYAQMEDKQSRTQQKGRRNKYTLGRQHDICTSIFGNNQGCQNFGLKWDQDKDTLAVKLITSKAKEAMQEVTKRKVLSSTSAIFDPLGTVNPVTVVGKILLQEICKKNTSWDEPITGEIERTWKQWQRELKKVEEIVFSRSLLQTIEEPVERRWLHGFGDASKQAYCAVIYLVQQQFSGTYARLTTSKTRLAPIKPKSIPRLELDGWKNTCCTDGHSAKGNQS